MFNSKVVLILACILLVIQGCLGGIAQLQPTLLPPANTVKVTNLCPQDKTSDMCLKQQQASIQVDLEDNENIVWLKISPDGSTSIMSVLSTENKENSVYLIAYDLINHKELWRLNLRPNMFGQTEDCYFIGSDKVGFHTIMSELIVFDLKTGLEIWREPANPDSPQNPILLVWYDTDNHFFVISRSKTIDIIDAETGETLESTARHMTKYSPLTTGGRPYVTDIALYLYDYGLMKISRQEKKIEWSADFVTFAENDHTGKNIGLAIASGILSALSPASPGYSSTPPDWMIGRTTEPVIVDNLIIASGAGVVHAIDRETGKIVWSQDFAVPQIAKIIPHEDRLLILAGGYTLFWQGAVRKVQIPNRCGIYCLHVDTGLPSETFQSPFNLNVVHRTLTENQRREYNEDEAWELEEDWGKHDQNARNTNHSDSLIAHTGLHLKDFCLEFDKLFIATSDEVVILDATTGSKLNSISKTDIGEPEKFVNTKEVIAVRTRGGTVVFDAKEGNIAWKEQFVEPEKWKWYLSPGHDPFMNLPNRSLCISEELNQFCRRLFWLDQAKGTLILPTKGPKIMAYELTTGNKAWELPVNYHTRYIQEDGQSVLYSIEGNKASIYLL